MRSAAQVSRPHRQLALGLGLALVQLGGGCAQPPEEEVDVSAGKAVWTDNGLYAINGLTSTNGLLTNNGLYAINGLASVQGLSSTTGLMTSEAGRNTVSYLVRCALPAGHSIVKQDQYGNSYTFSGQIGVAPNWENGSCDDACQQYVSACLMAHVNTAGVHIPLWLDSANPAIGWGQSADYPDQEGTFFGNIMNVNAMTGTVDAYYCDGSGFNTSVVPGRIGYGLGNGAPYRNYFGQNVLCSAEKACTKSMQMTNKVPDGYSKCGTWSRTITVWRRDYTDVAAEAGAIRFDFEKTVDGWSGPPLAASTAQKLSGSYSLAATLSGGGTFQIRRYNPTSAPAPGASITFHVWVPSTSPITSVVGEVTDAHGIQTSMTATNLKPGIWNTVTVNVPSDAYAPMNSIGVDIVTTGATTAYIDAVRW